MYIAAKALGGKDAEHSANCGVDLISLVAVVGSRFWKPVRTASQSLEDAPLSMSEKSASHLSVLAWKAT